MSRILLTLLLSASTVFGASYYYFDLNFDNIPASRSWELTSPSGEGSAFGLYRVEVTQSEFLAGPAALSTNFIATKKADFDQETLDAKSPLLKASENGMILFLRRTGHIATNAVTVPATIELQVTTNLLDLASQNPTNAAIDNLITRFHSLLNLIERNGGSVENATYHE